MIQLTKIFHFEMAHAIHGYPGSCKNIHGHSYRLYVTIAAAGEDDGNYIAAPGFIMDFKEIKQMVKAAVIDRFDHKLLLSDNFLAQNPAFASQENLVPWDAEPTAENLLLFIQRVLSEKLPTGLELVQLKLYETKDSYAEWINGHSFTGK